MNPDRRHSRPFYDNSGLPYDTAGSSHQPPPYHLQQPPYNTQPPTNSYQGHFPATQPSAHQAASSSSQHYSPGSGIPRVPLEPSGDDLTNQIKVLRKPGEIYQWCIGQGSFSDVFLGEYRKVTPRGMADVEPMHVAVKQFRINDRDLTPAAVNRRIGRESMIWVGLEHPNIQPYLGFCSNLGQAVALISPYCNNGTIKTYLAQNPTANKFQLIKDVILGLEYLHSNNIIHADLQWNNILVDENGNAVVTDFGRAKVLGDPVYSTPLVAGATKYRAPELLPASSEVNIDELFSKESDIYAYGMFCFEVYTDKEPFADHKAKHDWQVAPLILAGKRPLYTGAVKSLISENMWGMLEACWIHDPRQRPMARNIAKRMSPTS